jgi:hypothetical protein
MLDARNSRGLTQRRKDAKIWQEVEQILYYPKFEKPLLLGALSAAGVRIRLNFTQSVISNRFQSGV